MKSTREAGDSSVLVQTKKLQLTSKTLETRKMRALHTNCNFMALFPSSALFKNGKPILGSLLLFFSNGLDW